VMMNVRVSEKVVKHIVKRHRDWVEMLGLNSEEVGDFIVRVPSQPDEVYEDRARGRCKVLPAKARR
jgi:hypothetical protein